MSSPFLFRWRNRLLSADGPPFTTRLVLLVLSTHGDEHGNDIYPGTRTLATETGLSRTSVMKHLEAAEQDGWIRRRSIGTDRGHGWKRHVYELAIPKVVKDADHDTGEVVKEVDHVGGQGGGPRPNEGGQPHEQGGQPESGKVVKDVDHTSPVTSPKTSPSPPEGDAIASAHDSEHVESMPANELVAQWIKRRGERPPDADVKKQGAFAKRIATKYTREEIYRALDGMSRLFKWSRGEPWDLRDLERDFAKALVAPASKGGRKGYQDPAAGIDYAAEAAKHHGGTP